MSDTMRTPPSDPARIGAVWVAATGAFLLLAAATLFIAVRWDDIPHGAKLAAVVTMTGAFLLAGERAHRSLPATASVLWHVGALLVPVDIGALVRHSHASGGVLLLVEGIVCLPAFGMLGRVQRSSVLDAAAIAAGVALAGGIGAISGAPAPLVLMGLAVVAETAGQRRNALAWSLVGGLLPVLALTEHATMAAHGVLSTLGLVGPEPRLTAILASAIAAVIVGRAARERGDAGLAVVAAGIAMVGATATVSGIDGSERFVSVGVAAAIVVAQFAAIGVERDEFWAQPASWLARFAEVVGTLATPLVIGFDLAALFPIDGPRRPIASTTFALLALASVLAGVRRKRPVLLTDLAALAAATAATLTATGEPAFAAGTLAAGALLLALRAGAAEPASQRGFAVASVSTALYAAGCLQLEATALVAAMALLWVIALALDEVGVGFIGRGGLGFVLAGALTRPPREALLIAAAVGALAATDALRREEPDIAFVSAAAVPLVVAEASAIAGVTVDAVAVTFAVVATIVGGLGVVVADRWSRPFWFAAGSSWAAAVALAVPHGATLGTVLVLLAASLATTGAALGHQDVIGAAGIAGVAGTWLHLAGASVTASEAYLAPPALLLVVLGRKLERSGLSSWDAYAAPIVLLGGAGLAERIAGGGASHALVAGAVGLLAVVTGGHRRLAAPLLLGTALLVAVTAYESLAITAGVPTWAWLALGGCLLLGAGVAMELSATGPLETGRRLVDVVHGRFA